MTSINQKHQIMQSLESLDHRQTAKVLDYVRSLVQPSTDEHRVKQEALRQIRAALGNPLATNTTAF